MLPNTCWHQVNAVLSGGQFQKLMVATPSVATFRPSSQKQCQLIASFKSRAWPQLPDATIEEVAGSPSSSPHATSKFPIRLEVAPPHPAMLRLLQRRTACLSNRRSFCSTSCSLSSGMCVCVTTLMALPAIAYFEMRRLPGSLRSMAHLSQQSQHHLYGLLLDEIALSQQNCSLWECSCLHVLRSSRYRYQGRENGSLCMDCQ